jgi:hypothetical protein
LQLHSKAKPANAVKRLFELSCRNEQKEEHKNTKCFLPNKNNFALRKTSALELKHYAMCMFFYLVEQALKLSNIRTKKEVVQEALRNYVAWMKKKQLLDLKGNVKWEG